VILVVILFLDEALALKQVNINGKFAAVVLGLLYRTNMAMCK
jgi:hypothetical protein